MIVGFDWKGNYDSDDTITCQERAALQIKALNKINKKCSTSLV